MKKQVEYIDITPSPRILAILTARLVRIGAHSALNNGSGVSEAPMPSPDLGEGKKNEQ